MTIHVVLHEHRHGLSLSAHRTIAGAEAFAKEQAADTAGEDRYTSPEHHGGMLPEFVRFGQECGFAWEQIGEWTDGDESIRIESLEVQS